MPSAATSVATGSTAIEVRERGRGRGIRQVVGWHVAKIDVIGAGACRRDALLQHAYFLRERRR
jgi:hypothetical protein